ncbi:MAG: adenylate kinase [Acidimicrobiia bacterium]
MIPGVRLIMLGRQGAGKGTQCVRLSRHYVVPHISTGDMLRSAVKEDTAFGRRAKEIMDRGELVSDDIMIGIVEERLSKRDSRNRGYILDGFPRTVAQAVALIDITLERPIDLVVDLEVPREVVLARLASRRVCVDCGANYSLENKPAHPWTCDFCGGDVIQRADDTEDAIMRRLALYDEQTAPLHEFYAKRGELAMVDGVGAADAVLNRVIAVIEERRERGVHA